MTSTRCHRKKELTVCSRGQVNTQLPLAKGAIIEAMQAWERDPAAEIGKGNGLKTKLIWEIIPASLVAQTVKNLPAIQNTLEEEMAMHSSILASRT